MAKKELTEQQKEAKRAEFAKQMRIRRSSMVLRGLADVFEDASLKVDAGFDYSLAIGGALRRHNLTSHTIGGRTPSYSQLRIIYEMVREGKYGGLAGDSKLSGPIAIFQSTHNTAPTLGSGSYNRPEGWFPGRDYAVGEREN
jgi:hypothetical protein